MPVPLYAGIAAYQLISGFVQADMVAKQAAIQKQIDEENAKLAEFDAWRMEGYGQPTCDQAILLEQFFLERFYRI